MHPTWSASVGRANEARPENRFELFTEGDTLFDAMLEDIAGASDRVWLESYIFTVDRIGRKFVSELEKCAERGVDVRVRVDAFGSGFGFSAGFARRLRASGARFRWSHPWEWRRPWTFHRRNHRKLLVVDEHAAYIGGFNIAEVGSEREYGKGRWRDTHVRLTGPIVREGAAAFSAFGQGNLDWTGEETASLYFLTNHGRHCRYRLRCLLRDLFAEAGQRIWLTTPYFVPDLATQGQLAGAAAHRVDVRVLVPGKNDVRLVQWAGRAAYSRLIRAGVRIFEYEPRTLHAKTMIVDDSWSTIGTANFDYRSFAINYELNLVSRLPELNAELAGIFEEDMSEAREIRQRPWKARPLSAQVAELIGWGARRWL